MVKLFLSFFVVFLSFNCFAFEITGRVTDKTGMPVSGALVKFVEAKNPSKEYASYTDSNGEYRIVNTIPANNMFLFCYPNPFNRQTVLSFHIDRKQRIELAVYNAVGQKISVIVSGEYDSGHHQFVWDGMTHGGETVFPGFYVARLQTEKNWSSTKMFVLGGENTASPVWMPEDQVPPAAPSTETHIFSAEVSGRGFSTHHVHGIEVSGSLAKDFVIDREVWTPFSITGDYLSVYNGQDYTPFFIKGINMGSAVPGSWPGQMAVSSEQYARWFKMMTDAGFNTLRVYTLHFPRFYQEFARYNRENPDKPLYLLHGVWLDEDYPDNANPDLHTMTAEFDKDIRDVVDCVHGRKTLPLRFGYAYGSYTADVSPWVLGYIIGREIYAQEIIQTDESKPANTSFSGKHLSIRDASPSEVWATERLDRMIAHERANYGTNRPVSFSSWPTLDPVEHPSEPWWSTEDIADLDLNKVELTNAPGGLFISYHIYSYFPNFISRDEKYKNVYDEMGPNPYLAYLEDLRSHYTNYPVLVAEFGVPTSWGNARFSPSGMHHGGMNEEEQGIFTMRMFHNMYDTRYCGGIVFSWMDEWFKTTWITHPLSSGRRNLWHNITSPENNYGLIQFVPNPQFYTHRQTQNFNYQKISNASVWHDFTFFNVETSLTSPLGAADTLWVAFDTYKRNVGESALPDGRRVFDVHRPEFLLRVTADSALLFVTEAYNLQGITNHTSTSTSFQTRTTFREPWMLVKWENDNISNRPNTHDIGILNIHKGTGRLGLHHAVQMRPDGSIFIRIPWTLLHFSDPSNSMVVDDDSEESILSCLYDFACGWRYLNSIRSEGIAVTMVYDDEIARLDTYTWSDWHANRDEILDHNMYIEEEKASLSIIREGLRNNPFLPKMD